MSELLVHSTHGDYTVEIAVGAAAQVATTRLVLADPVIAGGLPSGPARIDVIGDESSKTLSGCETVLGAMHAAGLRRGDLVAAVGGGVVQDVATLSCSLYMRGVDWIYVPTTLMAMMDSCIGGKSSINAGGIKNLVGNFYPPTRILVDPAFIATLPQRAKVAGLGEAVKICFARGEESFRTFLASPAAFAPDADEATAALIAHVLGAKRWFVEVDELDHAERRLLNFGHSFGHAFEAACGLSIPHGIGVLLGVLAAIRHPAAHRSESVEALADYARSVGVSVRDDISGALGRTDWAKFRVALASDKKNSREFLRLVLPAEPGPLALVDLPLDEAQLAVAETAMRGAIEEVLG